MQYFKSYAFEKTSPLFPFGFGLSYSKFEYNALEIIKKDKETILVSVDIKNNSNYDGEEIVQLYFRDRISSVTRPVKELVDYRRISLKAFEAKTIKFEMPVESLAFFDIDMNYLVEPGEFEFMVGGSSNNNHLISKIIEIN